MISNDEEIEECPVENGDVPSVAADDAVRARISEVQDDPPSIQRASVVALLLQTSYSHAAFEGEVQFCSIADKG